MIIVSKSKISCNIVWTQKKDIAQGWWWQRRAKKGKEEERSWVGDRRGGDWDEHQGEAEDWQEEKSRIPRSSRLTSKEKDASVITIHVYSMNIIHYQCRFLLMIFKHMYKVTVTSRINLYSKHHTTFHLVVDSGKNLK